MHGILIRNLRPAPFGKSQIWLVALLFWLFTFALLSFRTQLGMGDEFVLLSARRLLGTTAGAVIFGLVLGKIVRASAASPIKPLAIIATILPASLAVLAARLLLDQLFYQEPLPLQDNVRWVIVWAGYFGLWVSACLALHLHTMTQSARAAEATRQAACAVPEAARPAERPSAEAIDWIVDAIAVELTALPPADRAALLDALVAKAGYELADERDPDYRVRNARVKLVQRLLCRSKAGSRLN